MMRVAGPLVCICLLVGCADGASTTRTYRSDLYRLQLDVPATFKPDPDYFPVRLSDGKGFVQLSATGAPSGRLSDACARETDHHLLPYGPKPRVDFVTLDGQLACRISVSGAVNPYTGIGVGYVVSLPEPAPPHPRAGPSAPPFPFVLVTADPTHAELIPRTLKLFERPAGPDAAWRESHLYRVRFAVPTDWAQTAADVGYEFQGATGRIKIDSLGGPTGIDAACRELSQHRRRPYGRNPRVVKLTIDGQPACRITPDGTEGASDPVPHALVVEYPEPLVVPGPDARFSNTYHFLAVDADGDHMGLVQRTLQFVREQPAPAVAPARPAPPAPPR